MSDIKLDMTLRDYFAAKAMQALCGNGDWLYDSPKNHAFLAENSYLIADVMLAERAKEE